MRSEWTDKLGFGRVFLMNKILSFLILCLLLSGCATGSPQVILSTPGTVTIKSPRNMLTPGIKTTQEIYDIAQKHCQKTSKTNAIATKAWLQPFDGNYHEFECKKP